MRITDKNDLRSIVMSAAQLAADGLSLDTWGERTLVSLIGMRRFEAYIASLRSSLPGAVSEGTMELHNFHVLGDSPDRAVELLWVGRLG